MKHHCLSPSWTTIKEGPLSSFNIGIYIWFARSKVIKQMGYRPVNDKIWSKSLTSGDQSLYGLLENVFFYFSYVQKHG